MNNEEFNVQVEQGVVLVEEIIGGICKLKDALNGEGSVEAFISAHEEVRFLAGRATVLQSVAPRSAAMEEVQRQTAELVTGSGYTLKEKMKLVLTAFAFAGMLADGSMQKQMETIMTYFPLLNDLITEYNNQNK